MIARWGSLDFKRVMWSTVEYSAAEAHETLEQEWNDLFNSNRCQTLSKSFVWFQAWNQCFGAPYNITVVCVRYDDRLVLVAPMLREQQSFQFLSLNSARLACNGYSPACSMLISDSLTDDELSDAWLGLVEHIDAPLFRVPQIPLTEIERLTTLEKFGTVRAHGIEPARVTPMIGVCGDWDEYLMSRSKSFRKGLKRKLKRVDATADVTVAKKYPENRHDPLFEEIFSTSGRSWKAETGADLAIDPDAQEFLLTLTDYLAPKGQILIWEMRVGPDLVAFEFQIQFKGVAYPLRADYDAAHADISPGIVLLYHTIRDLFEDENVVMYDSCADEYDYLTSWAQSTEEYAMLDLFAHQPKPMLVHGIKYKLLPYIRQLKQKQA